MTQPRSDRWTYVIRLNGRRRFTKLYQRWTEMKSRCTNPKHTSYRWYGGKGIRVCREWRESFAAFREWAIASGFRKELSIDRIDSSKDYSPENCRWATPAEQTYGTPQTRIITFRGETLPAPVFAKRYGISPDQLRGRLLSGWSVERALTTPIQADRGHGRPSKITPAQARWARECGLPGKDIAARLGVCVNYARRIARGDILTEPS